ncbi:thioredoxin family protein [Pedobacter sp. Du54]|uniref:thioredoxin family protein n=1 Tax=Pedobacter anseongensis TaxID=3133439 RepID=UPI003099D9CC
MKKVIFTLLALTLIYQTGFAVDFYKGTYQQALAKGKAENKLLFLYFTAKWCGPCNYMQRYIFPDTTVSTYIKQNYIALKLDIDSEEGKLVYYKSHQPKGPTGVPAFIIMNSKEEILKKDVGGMKIAQLQQFLVKDEAQMISYKALADSIATLQIKADIKKPTVISGLFFNARASNWKPGLKIGANLLSLTNRSQGMGYEIGLFFDRSFRLTPGEKKSFWQYTRYHFQPGISFSSQGGKMGFQFVNLELLNGYQIKKLKGLELTISPYAALCLGADFETNFNQFDYGLKTGIGKQYGTLQANLGYHFGLSNISTLVRSSLYNRGLYFSVGMTIGK